jgi:hypothetical protein
MNNWLWRRLPSANDWERVRRGLRRRKNKKDSEVFGGRNPACERENLLVISQNTLREKGSKIQMSKADEGSPTAASPVTRPVSWGGGTTTALLLARRRKFPDE